MRTVAFLAVFTLLLLASSCDVYKSWKLENDVKGALAKDNRTAMSDFEVSVAGDGVITITGEVDNNEHLDAVTLIAKAVPGVKQVINNCTTPEPASNGMLDDTVTPSVATGGAL